MFCAGVVSSASLVITLMVAGASTSLPATLEALSTVTSSDRRTVSSCFAFSSGFWPAAGGSWARSGAAVRTPRPTRARISRFIVVLLQCGQCLRPPAGAGNGSVTNAGTRIDGMNVPRL